MVLPDCQVLEKPLYAENRRGYNTRKEYRMDNDLTHFDCRGNAAMVDISAKDITERIALAGGTITMNQETLRAVLEGRNRKGDTLGTARLAGIMAAKRTAELIPLCHPLSFDICTVNFEIREEHSQIEAWCQVKLSAKTGAEMEALTGVSVALLTLYDMCKAMDRNMVIDNIRLLEKSGGESGHFIRRDEPENSGGLRKGPS
jgi:cyclic pyranopterin phosphate synthase